MAQGQGGGHHPSWPSEASPAFLLGGALGFGHRAPPCGSFVSPLSPALPGFLGPLSIRSTPSHGGRALRQLPERPARWPVEGQAVTVFSSAGQPDLQSAKAAGGVRDLSVQLLTVADGGQSVGDSCWSPVGTSHADKQVGVRLGTRLLRISGPWGTALYSCDRPAVSRPFPTTARSPCWPVGPQSQSKKRWVKCSGAWSPQDSPDCSRAWESPV